MEILRKFISALLALVMVVTMLPLSALAEESEPTITETTAETEPVDVGDCVLDVPLTDETKTAETVPEVFLEETAEPVNAASGTCGENLTWELDDGVLTISGTGEMQSFSWENPPWAQQGETITQVYVEAGVTTIGGWAFACCPNLESITIPDGITAIGDGAFDCCAKLASITIPDSVISIGYEAFQYCSSLTSVTIPDGVISIGDSAFANCQELVSVTMSDSVTMISAWAFAYCNNLKTVMLSDSLTSIAAGLFYSCPNLTDITLPEGITSIGKSAFVGCSGLTEITIPGGVTEIGYEAFYGCDGLMNITLPVGILEIGDSTFADCDGLVSAVIPEGVTELREEIFYGCERLESITIPQSVTTIGESAFEWCESLKDVYYGGSEDQWSDVKIYLNNGYLKKAAKHYNSTMPGTENVPTSGTCGENLTWKLVDGVLTISGEGYMDFDNPPWGKLGKQITDVYIEEGVTTIYSLAFAACPNLRSITIPVSVTNIGIQICIYLSDVYYGGSEEQWNSITINAGNYALWDATIHFLGAGTTPSAGPVKEYVDNSNIRINGAGSACAHFIGEPYQQYTAKVNGKAASVTANELGLFYVPLGTFDTVGEKTVTVEITDVGGTELSEPQVFQSKVTVTPLEFSQNWKVSLDPSVAMEFNLGGKLSLVQLEGSLAKAEGKIGVGAAMNISRSYSAEGETLELTSDKKIEKGQTYKCGLTGKLLKGKLEGTGLEFGFSGGNSVSYGLKIEDYSANNSKQQKAIGTYLLGEILALNSMNAYYMPFYRHLAEKYYQKGGFQIINGSASKISGTFGGQAGQIKINGVDIASILKAEVEASFQEAEQTASNGDEEKSLEFTLETDIAGLALNGEELLLDTSVLGVDFLGRDIEVAAKVSEGKKSMETTSLSSLSTQMQILMLGVPSTAEYNRYFFRDEAMQDLLSNTSYFDDYINKDRFVLSVLDLVELGKAISDSDVPIPYESVTKEKYAVSVPLEFGISLGVGGTLGIDLSFLADTNYTSAAGYAVDDRIVLQAKSEDLSDLVEEKKRYPAEIFTNCIQSLAEDAANFFKKVGGKIQEGVDAGWSWVKEKGESAREWLIEITSAPSKNDGAWGESTEIGILGSYVNFSLARQVSNPNDAYVTRTAMTVGRPFVVNVTDDAIGEEIMNFEEEPLEFTIRYAGEDLMAANYNAETQVISMYRYSDDGDYFEYIGGIHDADAMTVTAIITKPGQYILAAETIGEEGCGYELGDVNHDGKINAKDATLILQKSVGVLKDSAKFCEDCAEVSGDGKLNAKDSTLILQFSVGLRDSFPAQE